MCFGCSKELSQWDGSFEYPQHMFWLRNKVSVTHSYLLIKLLMCIFASHPIISKLSYWDSHIDQVLRSTRCLLLMIICISQPSNNLCHIGTVTMTSMRSTRCLLLLIVCISQPINKLSYGDSHIDQVLRSTWCPLLMIICISQPINKVCYMGTVTLTRSWDHLSVCIELITLFLEKSFKHLIVVIETRLCMKFIHGSQSSFSVAASIIYSLNSGVYQCHRTPSKKEK